MNRKDVMVIVTVNHFELIVGNQFPSKLNRFCQTIATKSGTHSKASNIDLLHCHSQLSRIFHIEAPSIASERQTYDIDGNVVDTWEGVRVQGLYMKKDETAIASDTHSRLREYNFDANFTKFTSPPQRSIPRCSPLGHQRQNPSSEVPRCQPGLLHNTFMFWGVDEKFVASGSEDNNVYIWHIKEEMPIAVLQGHTRTVNCVAWNPVVPTMLVSVSDDCNIRVWGADDETGEKGLFP
ncbi:putative WD repeat-containing protein 26 [Apostichopus japonicus]|uniref:Putative WD repeat-containing protein 26 n=1 Tax=Stichopus japonicus TaxID=307972 RepID=A0A2G8L4K6_STIJA|nr:putative WD repeat-containing protein 26 [Apostichopus japonicus]